jgi:hypothetical protein
MELTSNLHGFIMVPQAVTRSKHLSRIQAMRIYIPEDTDFATKKNNTENAA